MENTSTPSIRWLLALLAAPMLLCSPLFAADKTPAQFPAKKTHATMVLNASSTVLIANPGPTRTGMKVIIKRVPESVFKRLAQKAPAAKGFEYTVKIKDAKGLSQKQTLRGQGTVPPARALQFSFRGGVTGPLEVQVLMGAVPAPTGSSGGDVTLAGEPVPGAEIYVELDPDDEP